MYNISIYLMPCHSFAKIYTKSRTACPSYPLTLSHQMVTCSYVHNKETTALPSREEQGAGRGVCSSHTSCFLRKDTGQFQGITHPALTAGLWSWSLWVAAPCPCFFMPRPLTHLSSYFISRITFPPICNIWYKCQVAVTSEHRTSLNLVDKGLMDISFRPEKIDTTL